MRLQPIYVLPKYRLYPSRSRYLPITITFPCEEQHMGSFIFLIDTCDCLMAGTQRISVLTLGRARLPPRTWS